MGWGRTTGGPRSSAPGRTRPAAGGTGRRGGWGRRPSALSGRCACTGCGRSARTCAAGSRPGWRTTAGSPTPSCGTERRFSMWTGGAARVRWRRRTPSGRKSTGSGDQSGPRSASGAGMPWRAGRSSSSGSRSRERGWTRRTGPRTWRQRATTRGARACASRWETPSWGEAGAAARPSGTTGPWRSTPGTSGPRLGRAGPWSRTGGGPSPCRSTRGPPTQSRACAKSAPQGAPGAHDP